MELFEPQKADFAKENGLDTNNHEAVAATTMINLVYGDMGT